ncbi:hypothetical protein LZ31DRAFT_124326 [Colletotrichum somersetense]|nr:hypothetical protein LZ31DRAFT_124326 [Colletotrichum somersetense]
MMMGIDPKRSTCKKGGKRMAAGWLYSLSLSMRVCVCVCVYVVYKPTYPRQTFLPQPLIHVVDFFFFFFLFAYAEAPGNQALFLRNERVEDTKKKGTWQSSPNVAG